MRYSFCYKNTPMDFWQLSFYFIYGSMVGLCNSIFTVAMILLANRIWSETNDTVRIILVFSICLFPIIQPIGIYLRARKQAESAKEIEISFHDKGIHVNTDETISDLEWKSIKKVSKKPNMIVLFSTTTRGFILSNRVLRDQSKDFYSYVVSKMSQ